MSERAKRAIAELERRGWSLGDELSKQCGTCGCEVQGWMRYCPQCGARKAPEPTTATIEDIEAALLAAETA